MARLKNTPSKKRPAVFLDRDGVIVRGTLRNGKSYAPRRIEEFRLLPGAREAIGALHKRGFLIVVVTNQPDIANGLVRSEVVDEMHKILHRKLVIDAIEVCPHRRQDNCECRKPKPGMLVSAAKKLSIDLSNSYMVGDRCSDVIAGHSVGCYTVFVDRGYDSCNEQQPNAVVRSLPKAADHILRRVAVTHGQLG
jgi:D-glycero-D-manno-heptose 1,7-bisphosphate phosphatase